MLEIKIRPLPQIQPEAINPAHLHRQPGLRIGLYTQIASWEHGVHLVSVYLAGALLNLNIENIVYRLPDLVGKCLLFCCLFLIVLSPIVLMYTRKIAQANVYLTPVGDVFPTISKEVRATPRAVHWWTGWPFRARFLNRKYDLDLAVRTTNAITAERIGKYAKKAGYKVKAQTIDIAAIQALTDHFPSKLLRKVAKAHVVHAEEKADIWPLVRLIMARVLFRSKAPKKSIRKRKADEIEQKLEVKGFSFYIAGKLALRPLCLWLLLIATLIHMPLMATDPLAARTIAATGSVCVIFWTIWTIRYVRQSVSEWKHWLQISGNRPLGNLPLFLYSAESEPKFAWEELETEDFNVPLDDYLVDASTTYQLTVTFFAGTAFAFSRLLA